MTTAMAPGGHHGHVDTPGVDLLRSRDLARDAGDEGGLAPAAPLVVPVLGAPLEHDQKRQFQFAGLVILNNAL